MSRFKYQPMSEDDVKTRANQSSGGYDSYVSDKATLVKVKEGTNNFRILPPTWPRKIYGNNWALEVWVHRGVGPDNGQYLCVDEMRKRYPDAKIPKGNCIVCEARRGLDAEESSALKAKKQMLVWVINRDDERAGPLLWRLGVKLEKDLQNLSQDPKTGAIIQLADPEEGYDISFTRSGTKLNTDYGGVRIDRDPTPISPKLKRQEIWLDFIQENPVHDLLNFFDQEYLQQVYAGKREKDEDEEEDRPRRSRKPSARDEEDEEEDRPRRSKSSRGRDAEDEEEDEIPDRITNRKRPADEEDEEDDPTPKKRRAAAEDEEDDDDVKPRRSRRDEEDEEEEDERPKRRVRDEEEEEEERPKKRASRDEDEEEDEPAPKKRRVVEEEDEEEEDEDRVSKAKKSLKRLKPSR